MRVIVVKLATAGGFCQRAVMLCGQGEDLRRDSVRTRCRTLRDRLGPRFLFGDLGALVSRVRCGPRGTMRFARRLSSICHCVLRYRRRHLAALDSRLRFLGSCVFLRHIHLNSYVYMSYQLSRSLLRDGLPPLALRLLTRGMVGRGVVSVHGPVIVSVACSRTRSQLIIYGDLHPGGSMRSSNVKLEGLSSHCHLVYKERVAVRRASSLFFIGVPLLRRWPCYPNDCG